MLSARDIDFDDSPEFSRRYHLASTSEREARAFFDKGLRDHFESLETAHVESRNSRIVIRRISDIRTDAEGEEFMREALPLIEQLLQRARA
jgi:hypothetical protein